MWKGIRTLGENRRIEKPIIFRRTNPSGWSPLQYTLMYWYEASVHNITKDISNYVTQWNDLSGNGYHLTSAATKYPLWVASVLNGNAVVRFDGTNDYMQASFGVSKSQPNTIFVVVKISAAPSGDYSIIVAALTAATANTLAYYKPTTRIYMYAGTAAVGWDGNSTPTAFMLLTATFNGASSYIYKNGVQQATGNTGTGAPEGITVGSLHNKTQDFLNGDIAEIIGVDQTLTTAERQLFESYLIQKYAIV